MGELIGFEVKSLPRLKLVGKELRHSMDAQMMGDSSPRRAIPQNHDHVLNAVRWEHCPLCV